MPTLKKNLKAIFHEESDGWRIHDGVFWIADVYGPEDFRSSTARLFAASPRLLEGFEALLKELEADIKSEYEGTKFYQERLSSLQWAHDLIREIKEG